MKIAKKIKNLLKIDFIKSIISIFEKCITKIINIKYSIKIKMPETLIDKRKAVKNAKVDNSKKYIFSLLCNFFVITINK